MIKSFTNKIKTLVFSDCSCDSNVTSNRKRKRSISEGVEPDEDDDDVIVTSVKRARKFGPQTSTLNYLNTLIANPYQKMADWFSRKKAWSEHYFFKKAPNGEKPNGESRTGAPGGQPGQGQQVTSRVSATVDRFKTPGDGVKKSGFQATNGNDQPVRNTLARASEGVQTQIKSDNRSSRKSTFHPTSTIQTTSSSQSTQTTTSVQTDHSDIWHRIRDFDTVQPKRHEDRSLFTRPPRQKFTALECVRLDEKKKYQQLLQQFTKLPLEKSSYSPDGLSAASHLMHYGSRTEGSISGSNSSIELFSITRQPEVHRQKIVPTQKTRIPTPPRSTDYEHQRSPRPPVSVSPRRSLAAEQRDLSQSGSDDVICLEDEEEVICIADDEPRVTSPIVISPIVNGSAPQSSRSHLDLSRSPINRQRQQQWRRPCSPDFQSSKYLSEEWIIDLERQYSRANREAHRKIEEAEIKKKFYEEKHLKKDRLLENEVRQRLRLYDAEPAVVEDLPVEPEKEEPFPELTDEMLQVVNNALRSQPADEVLVEGYKLQIRRRDMESLAGLNWLNDEIINFYMNQLVERGEADGKPKVYAFNTFFYPKVMSQGHDSVRRWTRRVDIFSKDYILIPVHLGMHWCLAVIDFKKKMIRYFDSMGGNNMGCLNALKEYLCAESLDKKKQKFDLSEWKTEITKEIPQQMNGSDCGMFTCKFAEYITREADINFTQEHMPYFRKRMVYEIVKKKLLQ
ncbi:sentrin-specific protease 1-like [Saccostrea cucullata]|uniref:sentrin-specific protease 1-like n=1 Tax=Saccostrea cuccullata TaxID=36930 RepID=UPI002ED3D4DD